MQNKRTGGLVLRHALCGLAQPRLAQPQQARGFRFFEATLVWVVSGELVLQAGPQSLAAAGPSLVLADQHVAADLRKTPGGPEGVFRSIFLTLAPELLSAFYQAYPALAARPPAHKPGRVPVDADLSAVFHHCIHSIEAAGLSDERLRHRLMDLLLALAERGYLFARPAPQGVAQRLRAMFGADTGRAWTALEASKALAMSVSTLRRRLADEHAGFEALLVDVRMHHAMMLLQTTQQPIAQVAEACGYRSRTRFAERFRARFGMLPSDIR